MADWIEPYYKQRLWEESVWRTPSKIDAQFLITQQLWEAICAYNAIDMETVKATLDIAEEERKRGG